MPSSASAGAKPPPADARRALGWFFGSALTSAALVWGIGLVAPALSIAPQSAFILAYAAVTAEILALSWSAPRLTPVPTALLCALAVGALVVLAPLAVSPVTAALLTLSLGCLAALLGAALGARIEKPGQLAAVALVSAIADLWSVFDPSAPSARFAEQAIAQPDRLALFALPFPLLGTPLIPAVIGAGDVVFAALYVAAFRAHALSVKRVLLALSAGFALGLLGLLVTLEPLPLLPLLGAAVVLTDPAARSLTRREWRTVIGVCAALVVAIALRLSR
ncbi:MAG: hypothetical protein RLZZ450_4975 [Pseudomonadota bacterium]